ncbi:MAG: YebC/PmpR family DNA-binding transcriptional regulator [Bacilli bacterium]|nr:YebC/PmpR family DNA-binding transcriptional regulator [Bacilli bacterium]
MGRAFEVRKASIQKTGAAKAKLYSNFAKEIYLAAKNGGINPDANVNLKRLVDKAKKSQVPSDIIQRAIDKVNSGADESYTSCRYEGFGPGSSTIIVDCLTDNVNRTVGFVRAAFTKCKGKLGVENSVSHSYENLSIVGFKGLTEEEALDAVMMDDIDIKDIELDDDLTIVYGDAKDLHKIKESLKKAKNDIDFEIDEISMIPIDKITLDGEDKEMFDKLLSMLDDIEDVQNVYHNVNL